MTEQSLFTAPLDTVLICLNTYSTQIGDVGTQAYVIAGWMR